jgi:predicted ribosomally synthesized peptide with nif11-like leader
MSQEQAQAFIERLKTDQAFRQKVLAVEGTGGAPGARPRLALARAGRYECSGGKQAGGQGT